MSVPVEMAANVLPITTPASVSKDRPEDPRRDQEVPTAGNVPAPDSAALRAAKVTMASENIETASEQHLLDTTEGFDFMI